MQGNWYPEWGKDRRRELRRSSTKEESLLWRFIRGRKLEGVKFRRQCGIGMYIPDFFSNELRIVVELDGNHHLSIKQKAYDDVRTDYLNELGLIVVRFSNKRVRQELDRVLDELRRVIREQRAKGIAPFFSTGLSERSSPGGE